MSDLLEYAKSLGSCVIFHSYRRGDARDLSGNANHGTITVGGSNAGHWLGSSRGHAYNTGYTGAAGRIVVADAASIRSLALTVVLFMNMRKIPGYGARLISRRNVGATDFDIYGGISSAGDIEVYDGAVARSTGTSFLVHTRKQIVVAFPGDAQTPKIYADGGVFSGAFAGTVTRSVQSGIDLDIGSIYTGGAGWDTAGSYLDFLLFNAELTATQIGYLWEKWNQDATPDLIDRRRTRVSVPKNYLSSCVLQLDMAAKASGIIPDLSGNLNQGTVVEPANLSDGVFDKALELHGLNSGAGRVTVAAADSINTLPNITISAWVRPDSSGGGTVGYIIAKTQWAVYNYAGLSWAMNTAYTGAGAGWTWPLNAAYGLPYHLCITHARTVVNTAPKVYINGTEVTVTQIASGSGTLANDAAFALTVGASATGTSGHDGLIEDVRIYNEVLSAAQVRALYLEGARRATILTPRTAYPISPAAVGAGGKVGPWLNGSVGSAQWTDDGTRRGYTATGATRAAVRSQRAFGSWYWRAARTGAGQLWFLPIASDPDTLPGVAGQNGYGFVLTSLGSLDFYRLTGAAFVIPFGSGNGVFAADTEYEFWVTRSVAGVFTIYAKGGAFTSWTQLTASSGANPFTDTTHTTSNYGYTYQSASGVYLKDVRHFVGDMTPAEAESMELLAAA